MCLCSLISSRGASVLQDAAQRRPAEGEEENSSSYSLHLSWQRDFVPAPHSLQWKFVGFGCNSQTKVCLSEKDSPWLVRRHLRTSQPWQLSHKTTNKLQFPPDVFVLLLSLPCCSAVKMFLLWSTRAFTTGVSPVSHSSGNTETLEKKYPGWMQDNGQHRNTSHRGWSSTTLNINYIKSMLNTGLLFSALNSIEIWPLSHFQIPSSLGRQQKNYCIRPHAETPNLLHISTLRNAVQLW